MLPRRRFSYGRLGSGRSHHVPVHGQPIRRRGQPLHHERLRIGNVDVGGPPRSEHAAQCRHAARFFIFRRGADLDEQPTSGPLRLRVRDGAHWVNHRMAGPFV